MYFWCFYADFSYFYELSTTECVRPSINRASCSQNMVFMWDFNHPVICWKDNITRFQKSKRLLECAYDKFLYQMIQKPTRKCAMLDLVLTSEERVVSNMQACYSGLSEGPRKAWTVGPGEPHMVQQIQIQGSD